MKTDDLKHATISGAKWSLGKQACFQLITLVLGVALSRLLAPEEFGLLAMVMVFSRFGNLFSGSGLSRSLIHKQDISIADSSTVFWSNFVIGWLLAGLLAALAPSIASFYGEPELVALVLVIALNFILNSLCAIPRTLLEKELRFRSLFWVDATAISLSGLIAVGMALSGFGVWSLVGQLMFRSFFLVVLLWSFNPWRPSLIFEKAAFQSAAAFGLPLMSTNSLNYWVRNADKLLIGKFLGDQALGFYNKPYTLMLFPLANVTQVISKVMFPSLAKIKDDKQLVKKGYLRVVRMVSLLAFPTSIGAFVMAEPIILGLYGPQWEGSVKILRVLSLLGVSQSIVALNGSIYQSQGATMIQFKWGLLFKLFIIAAIVSGLPYGTLGIAIAYTIASILTAIPNLLILGRVIPVRLRDVWQACCKPLLLSCLMGRAVYSFLAWVGSGVNEVVLLVTGVPLGVVVYAMLVLVFDRASIEDVKTFLTNRRSDPTSPPIIDS